MIEHFSRKLEQQVLEQGLCPVLMSFILGLGHLWSFLLPDYFLPQLTPLKDMVLKIFWGLLKDKDRSSVTSFGLDWAVVPAYREPQNSCPILSRG